VSRQLSPPDGWPLRGIQGNTESNHKSAQAKGLEERHIQTVKKTLLKMFEDGKSLWESLAAIRSTSVSATLPAPSVLLQGRNLRGSLPFLRWFNVSFQLDKPVPRMVKLVHQMLGCRLFRLVKEYEPSLKIGGFLEQSALFVRSQSHMLFN
jgi:hypothetical protein